MLERTSFAGFGMHDPYLLCMEFAHLLHYYFNLTQPRTRRYQESNKPNLNLFCCKSVSSDEELNSKVADWLLKFPEIVSVSIYRNLFTFIWSGRNRLAKGCLNAELPADIFSRSDCFDLMTVSRLLCLIRKSCQDRFVYVIKYI